MNCSTGPEGVEVCLHRLCTLGHPFRGRAHRQTRIADLETEQAGISARLADPDLYRKEPGEVQKLNQRFAEIDTLLMDALERWETIEARSNGA